MDVIRIRLFGGLGVLRGNAPLPGIPTAKARSLLAYLVLHGGRVVHRDVVCGALWGEQTDADARKALRTALWRIRTVLEPGAADRGAYLRVDGNHLGFPGTAPSWVDTTEFEHSLAGISAGPNGDLPDDQVERLRRAASLYRGDLLDGFYDDWVLPDRERFRLAYLTALERLLAHYQARGRWLAAISAGREILRADPLREHVQRRLMICHFSMGDRPSALRQYESYHALVREELRVDPLDETRDLYTRIRDHGELSAGSGADRNGTAGAVGIALPRQLSREIDDALRSLQQLVTRLEETRPSDRGRDQTLG